MSDTDNAPQDEPSASIVPSETSTEAAKAAGLPAQETPKPAKPERAPAKGLEDLLANFALGPAWAKAGGESKKKPRFTEGGGGGGGRGRDDRGRDDKRRRDGDGRRDFGRGQGAGGGRFSKHRSDGGDRRDDRHDDITPPAPGVRVTIMPDPAALHLIVKEVHQVARVYSLFDIAATLLADRKRCRAVFEMENGEGAFWRGKLDDSVFLTRAEALAHFWQSRELRDRFVDEETVEVDPPSGNFVAVARCGISGEWLGPPNFHTYQTNLRRLHRERFANMPFDAYNARVRTERGEEAVNAWLESMKIQTRWRLKKQAEDDGAWIKDAAEAARVLGEAAFDDVYESTKRADVSASVAGAKLSPGLLSSLKRSGGHTRKHPAMLIPAVCKALESEHLAVFKRKGKLYTGPARPLALPAGAVLAERPGRMVEWIRANKPAKLEGLWQAVLPEGGTAPPAEYAADLFWMLQQGHVLLFTDDTLVVQEHHEPPAKKPKAAKKKAKKATAEAPNDPGPPDESKAGDVAEVHEVSDVNDANDTIDGGDAVGAVPPEAEAPAAEDGDVVETRAPELEAAPEPTPAADQEPEPDEEKREEPPTA